MSRADMKECKTNNIPWEVFSRRVSNGWSKEDALLISSDKYNLRTDHNGIEYKSITGMCEAWGITKKKFYEGLNSGLSVEDTLSKGIEK